MLVLTRKSGEQIKIGEDITISVLEISKGGVRLGIDAPKNVSIYRYEVYERIMEENIRASQGVLSNIEDAIQIWRKKETKE